MLDTLGTMGVIGILAWIVVPLASVGIDIIPAWRAGRRRVCDITCETPSNDDFEVLVPIYGSLRYLENVDYLRAYGSRVVLCTTTDENAPVQRRAERTGALVGFPRLQDPRTRAACLAGAAQRRRPDSRQTHPRGAGDGDGHLRRVHRCRHGDRAAVAEARRRLRRERARCGVGSVAAVQSGTLLARFQGHEYRMAMRMRRLYRGSCREPATWRARACTTRSCSVTRCSSRATMPSWAFSPMRWVTTLATSRSTCRRRSPIAQAVVASAVRLGRW